MTKTTARREAYDREAALARTAFASGDWRKPSIGLNALISLASHGPGRIPGRTG